MMSEQMWWTVEFRAPDWPGEVGGHYHNERMGVQAATREEAIRAADLPHGCQVTSVEEQPQ